MNRAFLITAVLLLSPFPAFSQNAPGGDGHDSSYSRKDRDLEDILRDIGDHGREGLRRGGASFFLRNGDAMVAVRCDPQELHEIMRRCHSHAVGPGPIDAALRGCAGHSRGDASVEVTAFLG